MTQTQIKRFVDLEPDAARARSVTAQRDELYLRHSAPNTLPQGNLRSDVSPKAILRAAQIMLAKSTLSRKRLPVRLKLDEFRSPEFRYDTSSAEKVLEQLERVPLNAQAMRWIHHPDAVLSTSYAM